MDARAYDASDLVRASKFAIQQDPTSSTLLAYSALVTPDPLQVGDAGTITLVVSNSTHQAITCASIAVTLPIGTNAKDLITVGTGLQIDVPTNWQSTSTSGVVTFTPRTPDAGVIEGGGLSFVIANLAVNAQPGTAAVTVAEKASSPSQPAEQRTATVSVPKFPLQFQVSGLQTTNLQYTVAFGGSVTLQWSGSPSSPDGTYAVTYTLEYQPGDNVSTGVSQPVSNVGPYVAQNLTHQGSVDFTLIARVAIPGQDNPLIVQRYAAVNVETPSISFTVLPSVVGVNGLVCLSWTTANVASCTLNLGDGPIPTTGVLYAVVPQTQAFTLAAFDAAGAPLQEQQFTVTVDPTIQPNIAGQQIIGLAGGAGSDGLTGAMNPVNGGDGSGGGNAVLTVTLPPLDTSSTPARVMPITLIGGNGGTGGDGSGFIGMLFPGGNAGNGGAGGNATLTATFEPSAGAPAQYIITMSAGQGGGPGVPGTGMITPGSAGGYGSVGAVTMTFDGIPGFGSN